MGRIARVATVLTAVACLAGPPIGVRAQAPAEVVTAQRFTINSFEVMGNTLLPVSNLEFLFEPYTGRDKDFADIQRAPGPVQRERKRHHRHRALEHRPAQMGGYRTEGVIRA